MDTTGTLPSQSLVAAGGRLRDRLPTQRAGPEVRATLWARLRESGDPAARDELIIGYSPLVVRIARSTPAMFSGQVDLDDLVSAGTFGLIDAIDKYDDGRGVAFEQYASSRIRGAIIDELRAIDWAPRSLRARARDVARARAELESFHRRTPTQGEIADHLGVDPSTVHATLAALSRVSVAALDAPVGARAGDGLTLGQLVRADEQYEPAAVAEADATRKILLWAVDHLGERTSTMLRMYYFEGKTFAEVGRAFGVSESRISQIHTAALRTLRDIIQAAEAG